MPEPTDPDLILRVTQETTAGGKQLKFVAKARDPRHRLYLASFDSPPLGSDAQQDVQRLIDEISQMPRGLSTEWSEDSLAGHGAELLERLVPVGLRRRLWELRGAVRTLHILSDEVWIPWELLRLEDPGGHGDGHFLVEAFSVTRWLLDLDPALELPLRQVALVVPKDSDLPTSSSEAVRLRALGDVEHEVTEVPASYPAVRDALAAGLFDGWHFAGHGVEPKDSPYGSGIRLEGGVRLHPNHLRGPARQLGRTRPLVFLNACHSGRGATWLSGMAGLGSAFLTAGAGAFVGTHWEVEDEQAYRFAEALYSSFFSGQEIGEAVRQARAKLHQEFPGTSDWLAYTVFAHPLARCAQAVEQQEEPDRPARKRPPKKRKTREADEAPQPARGTDDRKRSAPTKVVEVPLVEPPPPPPEPPQPAGPADRSPANMPEFADPDLTLRVTQETLADGRKALRFLANSRERLPGLYYSPYESRPFEVDPQQHFQQLFGDIALIPRDRSHEWLQGRGAILCRDLLPKQLQRKLWALLDSVRTVQILSDDLWIPWELLWLRHPDDPAVPGRFLVEAFSVTRWHLGSPPILELPLRRIALVAPRNAELPMTSQEKRRLVELSGASREVVEISASRQEVMQAMAGGAYDGWHFAGHGLASAESPQRWSIVLEQHEELQSPHLYSLAGQFGRAHPLVFLNACSSGRGAASLSGAAGLAAAFLDAGAGAFLGSHWELEDEHAFCFAEELYAQLFSEMEIGEAVREARAKVRRDFPDTSDWLAYTVFSHPLARCVPAVEQRKEPDRSARKRPPSKRKTREADEAPRPAQDTGGRKRSAPPKFGGVAEIIAVAEPPPHPEPPKPAGPAPGTELINEKDGTVLLYVPGGEVALGAEGVHPWSRPVRRVRMSPFWIGRHPITNEQYGRFLDENPEADPPAFWEAPRFNQPRQPVVGVSWEEARAYCRWAGLELPTEAQWEVAARGTDRRPYPWGKEPPTPRRANFNGTSGGTTPVDAHPAGAGPYGTLDQAGNVWEWCADPWASNLYQLLQDDQVDPIARGDGAVRALRGGSWMNPAKDLHAAYRDRGTTKLRFNTQGFRCVRRPT